MDEGNTGVVERVGGISELGRFGGGWGWVR